MLKIWAGAGIGKEHHHCVALNARGEQLLLRRVSNNELELLELIQEVLAPADQGEVLWAVDTNHGSAALLIGLLLDAGQPDGLPHRPGRPPGLGRLPRTGQDRRQGRPRHRRPNPHALRTSDCCGPATKSPSIYVSLCVHSSWNSSRPWSVP